MEHKRPTISCEEKLELLKEDLQFSNWGLEQIIKCLYFHRNEEQFIGVITPAINRTINIKEIFYEVLRISRKKAKGYHVNPKNTPTGMSWGTCTPFALSSTIGEDKEIGNLIFYEHSKISNKLVDISIGGNGRKMHQISMHLPYKAIYEILAEQFKDRIHLYRDS